MRRVGVHSYEALHRWVRGTPRGLLGLRDRATGHPLPASFFARAGVINGRSLAPLAAGGGVEHHRELLCRAPRFSRHPLPAGRRSDPDHDRRGTADVDGPRGGGPGRARFPARGRAGHAHADDGRVRGHLSRHHPGRVRYGRHRGQFPSQGNRRAPAAGRCGGSLHPGRAAARWTDAAALCEPARRRRSACGRAAGGRTTRPALARGRHCLARLSARRSAARSRRARAVRRAQHPVFIRHHRRAQGHSLDADHAAQVRRRCALPPGCPARRPAGLADQPGLDDGAVAGLRRPAQPRGDRPVLWRAHRPRVLCVRAGHARHPARSDPQPRQDVAARRRPSRSGLERVARVQLDRRMLQRPGHALADGAGRRAARHRVFAAARKSAAGTSRAR